MHIVDRKLWCFFRFSLKLEVCSYRSNLQYVTIGIYNKYQVIIFYVTRKKYEIIPNIFCTMWFFYNAISTF